MTLRPEKSHASNTVDGRNPAPPKQPWSTPLFVDIYGGIEILGCLMWCEMDFVHPQYDPPERTPSWAKCWCEAPHACEDLWP